MKQGADDAMEARKAFKAVHEDIEHATFESKVSSALVERVCIYLWTYPF